MKYLFLIYFAFLSCSPQQNSGVKDYNIEEGHAASNIIRQRDNTYFSGIDRLDSAIELSSFYLSQGDLLKSNSVLSYSLDSLVNNNCERDSIYILLLINYVENNDCVAAMTFIKNLDCKTIKENNKQYITDVTKYCELQKARLEDRN